MLCIAAIAVIATSWMEIRKPIPIQTLTASIKRRLFLPDRFVNARVYRQVSESVAAVEDNGTGVPPEHLARIWDRFYRADDSKAVRQGMVIGLSMVRRIALDHGGTVLAESEPDRGSRFAIRIQAIDP